MEGIDAVEGIALAIREVGGKGCQLATSILKLKYFACKFHVAISHEIENRNIKIWNVDEAIYPTFCCNWKAILRMRNVFIKDRLVVSRFLLPSFVERRKRVIEKYPEVAPCSLFSCRVVFLSLRSAVYYLFSSLATSTSGAAFAEISPLSATMSQFRWERASTIKTTLTVGSSSVQVFDAYGNK